MWQPADQCSSVSNVVLTHFNNYIVSVQLLKIVDIEIHYKLCTNVCYVDIYF